MTTPRENNLDFYELLKESDPHILNIHHWMNVLSKLADHIHKSGEDDELYDCTKKLLTHLNNELGIRFSQILTHHIVYKKLENCIIF